MQSNIFTRSLTFALMLGVLPMMAQTPFFTETFNDEATARAAWTFDGENEGPETWEWTNDPGWSGSNFSAFGAPTATDGFFYFDSATNGLNNSNHVMTMTSSAIDCSGQDQVFLEMYTQYVYYFYDRVLFGDPNVEIGVSTDGTNFVYQSILLEVDPIDYYESVQRITLALPDAINQPNVYIQLRWTGNREFFLNVDDIALFNTDPILGNDLRLDHAYIPPAFATPLSQVDSIFFLGLGTNIGADPQTNVRFRSTVLQIQGENVSQVYQDSSESTNMLMSGERDTLFIEEGFLPTTPGSYVAVQTLVSDEDDDFFPNNRDFFEFVVTNRTFANDDGQFNWPPLLPAEISDNFWEAANLYYVPNGNGYEADTIRFMFFADDDVHIGQDGTVLLYKIEEDDDPAFTSDDLVNVGFNNFQFTAEDEIFSMKSVELLREDGFTPGVPLEDSTEYIAMVSVPDDVWIMYSYRDIQPNQIASLIREGGELSRFDPELAFFLRMTIREAEPNAVTEPELDDARINSFPNPAKDFYRIDLDLESSSAVQLQLMTMTGQTILQREYTALQRDRIDLDVSQLAAGAYLVKVRTEEGVKTLKFTKQ